MCSIYSFRSPPDEVRLLLEYLEQAEFPPRDFITPGSPIAIVRMERGARHFALVRWGFVPGWAKDVKPGRPQVNARAEGILDKPMFRNAMRRRRCLIPADGFYEWSGNRPGHKQAWRFERPQRASFAFAGLWEPWMGADGSEIETAAIITTAANRFIGRYYSRMPVIIQPTDYSLWLCGEADEAAALLRPAPEDFFVAEPAIIPRGPAARPTEEPQLKLF